MHNRQTHSAFARAARRNAKRRRAGRQNTSARPSNSSALSEQEVLHMTSADWPEASSMGTLSDSIWSGLISAWRLRRWYRKYCKGTGNKQ